ncbi:NADH-quinone oxidoreductase subunit G [Arsenicicoccus piscis]|nr:NADH-quinone oxidoreductase subunit G [Arsenicicoccus piscis]MCH8627732.1 NADH-quinone oxidoreductase subunit G [Arsenicicoccus piscis]
MTATTNATSKAPSAADLVEVTIDGVVVKVPKGTMIIRAAEQIGIQVPRFCDHPLLDPVGACRQCLVEVAMPGKDGSLSWMPKPQPACAMAVGPGMHVKTQQSSAVADKAQHGVMELLLINHPLDCPVCDKGGECPLQNQAMSNGRVATRFTDVKRTYAKPVNISTEVLLDRERCILCQRCTRFSEQIAGDPFISLTERGAVSQIGIYQHAEFQSYFSGNTVQICPVGALTGAAYRFRSRPFDLVSTPSTCEHCASGCSLRTDHRRGVVLRRLAGNDPEVNEEWSCDKGRWAFMYATTPTRVRMPLVRKDGELVVASWPEALAAATAGLEAAAGRAGVLVGGRVSAQDSYAYAKFARTVLHTNSVDFRARPHSAEEAAFLAEHVATTAPGYGGVTYTDLEQAGTVVLAGFEPEDESPIVFLRLRKAARKSGTTVYAIAPFASAGTTKMRGTVLPCLPGEEAAALRGLAAGTGDFEQAAAGLKEGGVILVGERLVSSPGGFQAAVEAAQATGARLAWVPRRAGERAALETGALPTVYPGGRPIDASTAAELAALWQVDRLPTEPGLDTSAMLRAASSGELAALVVGGVELADLPDQRTARAGLERAFVVSLETHESPIAGIADVVLPVASFSEKAGAFVDWEGRIRPFELALDSELMSDYRVLDLLASELGEFLGTRSVRQVDAEMTRVGPYQGARGTAGTSARASSTPSTHDGHADRSGQAIDLKAGRFRLATWRQLIDDGALQEGEPYLAGTARPAVARMSAASADAVGLAPGDTVVVSTAVGSMTLPLELTAMVDGVVWVPTKSAGQGVRTLLDADHGSLVTVTKGGQSS